jgi:hypothetical protein
MSLFTIRFDPHSSYGVEYSMLWLQPVVELLPVPHKEVPKHSLGRPKGAKTPPTAKSLSLKNGEPAN